MRVPMVTSDSLDTPLSSVAAIYVRHMTMSYRFKSAQQCADAAGANIKKRRPACVSQKLKSPPTASLLTRHQQHATEVLATKYGS